MFLSRGRFALQRISALSQANCNGLPHKKGAWRLVSSGSSGPSDSVEHDIMSSIAKKVTAGQPTPITHPHLLQPDEITVGISVEEYRSRRAKVMELLCKEEGRHHVLVLFGMPTRYMVEKIPFMFRQDTDMLYLSGCLETDCVLVLHTVPSLSPMPLHKAVMFCPAPLKSQAVWDGPSTAASDAPHVWGVDEGLPVTELVNYLTGLEESLQSPTLWYREKDSPASSANKTFLSWVARGRAAGVENPKRHIHKVRLVKSEAEQSLMRQACRISAEAMRSTMAWSRPNMSEHDLFTKVDYENRIRGASFLAYPPVVGGGDRANIIHYINNNQIIEDGEMVLMDAGGEYHGYSGDVSRTWPINGTFTAPQRALYEAILHLQSKVMSVLNEHRPSLDQLYRLMCINLVKVLVDVGVISPSYNKDQQFQIAMALCPHHVSHYLGMDVHDTASIPRNESIVPGSVITVEPGVYIPRGCRYAPSCFHGMGIRIEDDVLITDTGCDVLSDGCPRHPDDIQKLMRDSRKNNA